MRALRGASFLPTTPWKGLAIWAVSRHGSVLRRPFMGLREYTALYIIIQTDTGRIHSIFSVPFTNNCYHASITILEVMVVLRVSRKRRRLKKAMNSEMTIFIRLCCLSGLKPASYAIMPLCFCRTPTGSDKGDEPGAPNAGHTFNGTMEGHGDNLTHQYQIGRRDACWGPRARCKSAALAVMTVPLPARRNGS